MKVTIKKLTINDLEDFKTIRLSALFNAPQMFGSTYEREVNQPLEFFSYPIENYAVFAAYVENKVVGLTVFSQNTGMKDKHKAQITSVYVLPEFRQKGIANQILNEVLRYGKQHAEQILLSVVESNESAIKLYKKHGFQVYGIEPKAMKMNNQYDNNVLMIYFYP